MKAACNVILRRAFFVIRWSKCGRAVFGREHSSQCDDKRFDVVTSAEHTRKRRLGSVSVVAMFTLLAAFELVADKMP